MRAVISGATGAIGMSLINELIANQHEVLVLCRESSPRSKNIPTHKLVKKFDCPLDSMNELEPTEKYDVFFHFAWSGTWGTARSDLYMQEQNVRYTLDAVELAQRLGCHTFIGAGSQAEYGRISVRIWACGAAFHANPGHRAADP